MLRYYYLIVASGEISITSMFFHVSVPSTPQGARDCAYLTSWAAETQNYFSIRNNEASQFVNRVAESIATMQYMLPWHSVSARFLVSYIKEHNNVPKLSLITRSAAHLRRVLCPIASQNRLLNVIRNAEAKERRKPKFKAGRRKG